MRVARTVSLGARWSPHRVAVGLVGAAMLGSAAFLTSAIFDRSLGGLMGAAVGAASALVVLVCQISGKIYTRGRDGILSLALLALTMPLAFNLFVHLDSDRYLWVIAQAGPCSHMGSAAFMVSTVLISWLFAVGALGVLLGTRLAGATLFPRVGIYVGAFLASATLIISALAPEMVAAVLRCR
jgi:hypothetical protein